MKKNFVLVFSIAWMIISCGNLSKIIPPATPKSLTSIPPYVHYSSPKELDIHLEFDYPDYWIFYESKYGFITINLYDPRFLALPTPDPNGNHHPAPNDLPYVGIWIQPLKPDQTVDLEFELRKKNCSQSSWKTFLKDYEIVINKNDAQVLECQQRDPELNSSWMFVRRILFVVDNKMYEIYFTVSENERRNEFEQGYEYFFNSIKIIP